MVNTYIVSYKFTEFPISRTWHDVEIRATTEWSARIKFAEWRERNGYTDAIFLNIKIYTPKNTEHANS